MLTIALGMQSKLQKTDISDAFTYEEFRLMGKDLLMQGKTTGHVQNADMLHYSRLNDRRMDRLDKVELIPALQTILKPLKQRQYWLVIAELWCGDVAQNLPTIAKLAATSPHTQLRIALRDDNPEVMNHYLTNGGKAIPKVIAVNEGLEELWVWGPRPKPAQELMNRYKQNPNAEDKMKTIEEIQLWYAKDNTQTLQKELLEILTQ